MTLGERESCSRTNFMGVLGSGHGGGGREGGWGGSEGERQNLMLLTERLQSFCGDLGEI